LDTILSILQLKQERRVKASIGISVSSVDTQLASVTAENCGV